jgi:hypothetical protein
MSLKDFLEDLLVSSHSNLHRFCTALLAGCAALYVGEQEGEGACGRSWHWSCVLLLLPWKGTIYQQEPPRC